MDDLVKELESWVLWTFAEKGQRLKGRNGPESNIVTCVQVGSGTRRR